ncbi:General stress protein 20U [compost metagenome]
MSQYLALSGLKEAVGGESAKEMVAQLVKDFAHVSEELKSAISAAEELSDQPTADLLIGIRTSVEKNAWMLNAYLA